MWTVKVRREERGTKVEVRLKEKIPGVFWPVHQAIRRGEVTEVVAKGGRGSGKSSYLSMELVWQLLRHPDQPAACALRTSAAVNWPAPPTGTLKPVS